MQLRRTQLIAVLLSGTLLLSGCTSFGSKQTGATPCTVRGLAQAALPALTSLPAWPFPEPEARQAEVGDAGFATLYQGTEARMIMDNRRAELVAEVKGIVAGPPIQVVRKGAWRTLWPQVSPCLAGRPVVRLGYSQAKRLEMPNVALLSFRQKEGPVAVPTSALWVAPSRSKAEPTWIIATAMGPVDQRSLIYRQPNTGYTLDGPVTVMALDSTEAARTFAADLAGQLAQYHPTEAQAKAQAEATSAVQAGEWNQAANAYERLLVLTEREAREPGPPRPDMPFFAKEYQVVEISPPEVLLQMAQADMKAGRTVYGAREALVYASYLAEEQGKQELLAGIRSEIRAFIAQDHTWVEMQHRLAELEPGNAENWWKLAELRIIAPGWEPEPVVAVAEAVGGADPKRAAALYLRQAGEAVVKVSSPDLQLKQEQQETERATRLLTEALRRQPDNAYGIFLKGVRESRLGNLDAAKKLLASVDGSAARHEQAIAGGSQITPALSLDLYAKPDAMTEGELKEAYRSMGYWNYAAKLPAPPSQQAVWAPSGQWLATTCTRFTGQGIAYATDLCLVKVPEGTVDRIAATPYQMVWTNDGLLYTLRDGGLWFVAPGGAPRKLAAAADEIAVGPGGSRVAYTSSDGLWVLDLRRGAPYRVTSGKQSHPLWSPDGRELFFAREGGSGPHQLPQHIIYRMPADGESAPIEVGGSNGVSLSWFNIVALRWWEPGKSLLVRHSLYAGLEQTGQATILPLDGSPVTVESRAPTELRDRVTTAPQFPDQQRDLIWVLTGSKLVPVPIGAHETPHPFDLGAWPGFANPEFGAAAFAPAGAALAYTYSFGGRSYLFALKNVSDGLPLFAMQVHQSLPGAMGASVEAAPLNWYREQALPGWPLSWSPDGRYLAWLKGDRLVLYSLE